ncbi:MAG: hypothetical protein UGF89_06430 [Acutalibacteraceae bacterium]|nr:hypothetical protein [Acutalibacteraceae bacterium]
MLYEKNKYFVKNGKAFAIDDMVKCVDKGDLDGLVGKIIAIKTEKDCTFPNNYYEIIVDMLPPNNPNIHRKLLNTPVCEGLGCLELGDEVDFASLLKGVVFTNVDSLELYDVNIKALKPYSCAVKTEPLKAYIVEVKNDFGKDNTIQSFSMCYSDLQDALTAFARTVALAQDEHRDWLNNDDINITVAEDRFFATTCKNFLQVAITIADVSINPTQQRLLSEEHDLFHHTEDVRGKLYERWQEEVISDEDYCRLYEMAPELAQKFEDVYSDNSVRAEVFWDVIDLLIDEEVDKEAE